MSKTEKRNPIDKGSLESLFESERAKSILSFAEEKRKLYQSEVMSVDGSVYPASQYLIQLYCNASEVFNAMGDAAAADEAQETLQIVAMLMTLERIRTDCWDFGSKLDYDLMMAGFRLSRNETEIFYAQNNDYRASKDKTQLMEKHPIACALYCGNLLTMHQTLIGRSPIQGSVLPAEVERRIGECFAKSTPQETLEALFDAFVKEYASSTAQTPSDNEEKEKCVSQFMAYLRNAGFYRCPASTKYHGAYAGGLAVHTAHLISWHLRLASPADASAVGRLVLADICHDLCKIGCYQPKFDNIKIYCADGNKTEPDGRRFRWESVPSYFFEDPMPIGHGRKSLFMALRYLGSLIDEEMAAAIDGHMGFSSSNPDVSLQMMHYPMALHLHMADCMAAWVEEKQ